LIDACTERWCLAAANAAGVENADIINPSRTAAATPDVLFFDIAHLL